MRGLGIHPAVEELAGFGVVGELEKLQQRPVRTLPLSGDELVEQDDVFLLDVFTNLYVWIGSEAPWRGRRMTRTSWQKYLPPNCAPTPICWVSL